MKEFTSSNSKEGRKYTRLDTVFPIEFQIITKAGQPEGELHEGFTRNVGKGGMCLFVKKLKGYKQIGLDLIPKETTIKLVVNIPVDKEPIECSARVEWLERRPGRVVDTYIFGVSYEQIEEEGYRKIKDYVQWLRVKSKLIYSSLIILFAASVLSIFLMNRANEQKTESQDRLVKAVNLSKEVKVAKEEAEEKRAGMENLLKAIVQEHKVVKGEYERIMEEKQSLEESQRSGEEDKADLQAEIDELTLEKEELEGIINEEEYIIEDEADEIEAESGEIEEKAIADKRLKDEGVNYNKFREYILNEKIQSLSAYVSSHRSSIYYTSALFALAELRYKCNDKLLAIENYEQVIEKYPKSKYALYASHRLDQIGNHNNYGDYSLKDFSMHYNLPDLFDYRNIEPYVK